MDKMISASEMSASRGIDARKFRRALRAANFDWHSRDARWTLAKGSHQHQDMERVLLELATGGSVLEGSARRAKSDEAWIIDICDRILGIKALRQHRFPFLLGDPGRAGRRVQLPVDAYYPDLNLVV